jgi:hypothetical protein
MEAGNLRREALSNAHAGRWLPFLKVEVGRRADLLMRLKPSARLVVHLT